MISVGANIKQLREDYGISRIDMATELGYSTAQYGKIERDIQNLDCQGLAALCCFLHCRPERIVFGQKDPEHDLMPDYFSGYSETEKRQMFRTLYILLDCQQLQAPLPFHKMFGSDLLLEISESEKNIIPLVLEYERRSRKLTKRDMIKFIDMPKNKYYALLNGEKLSSIQSLIKITQTLGYDMSFLLLNKVRPELFLREISDSWSQDERDIFRQELDLCLTMGELSEKFIKIQRRKRNRPES